MNSLIELQTAMFCDWTAQCNKLNCNLEIILFCSWIFHSDSIFLFHRDKAFGCKKKGKSKKAIQCRKRRKHAVNNHNHIQVMMNTNHPDLLFHFTCLISVITPQAKAIKHFCAAMVVNTISSLSHNNVVEVSAFKKRI